MIPVMNKTHPIQTSHLILLLQIFVLSSKQYGAAQSVQWLWYVLEYLGFKSWQKQENDLFSKTSRPAPALIQPPTPAFSSGSKVASADSLITHIYLEPCIKISGAIPPLNLSPSMAHIGTTLLYLYLLPMYISLNRSQSFWSYKGTLSMHYLPLTCTQHDTFISSSLIQLH